MSLWPRDVPARVANYRTRLRFGTDQHVVSVVLCLSSPGRPEEIVERFIEGTTQHDRIEVGFRVIRMWEQSYSLELLRRCSGLVPLAALCDRTTAEDLMLFNRIIEETPVVHEEKLDLQAILGVMAGLRGFPGELLRAIIKEDMVHEHPILKEWEERAYARGLEQGRVRQQRLIRRFLAKLGVALDTELDARLSTANLDQLEALAEDLFGADPSTALELVRERLHG